MGWFPNRITSIGSDRVPPPPPKTPETQKTGVKYDAGKPRAGLVLGGFSLALLEVSKVGTFGAEKYTDDGWTSVPNGRSRYTDAMLRHILQDLSGEEVDAESGIAHDAHAAWNALARLELKLRALKSSQ